MNRKARAAQTARIVSEAKRHVGYRAQPQRKSAFQLKGYLGQPWGGTFIDRVLHDALGDFAEVRFVSTVTALAYYVNRNGVYHKPRVGDIVFFNFSTDPQQPFEQPHVGVVVTVNEDGSIRTVEGETSPGTPQGSQLADGVFERVRYSTDVLGYVRPTVRTVRPANGEPQPVKMSYFESNPSTRAKATETVQRALNRSQSALTFNRGKKDGVFKSAFGLYARERGTVENRGDLIYPVLDTLATETGEFTVE
jgi:hypothetical protein